MDSNPQLAKPISDDQELAKVLAGVSQQTDEPLQFDTPPAVAAPEPAASNPYSTPGPAAPPAGTSEPPTVITPPASEPPLVGYNPPVSTNDLEDIKKDALQELRPLVDKLDIDPEEKFDTYLLLLRSTDDKALIAPAHAAAQAITDETRRAQALLDVIKEIDYLSAPKQ